MRIDWRRSGSSGSGVTGRGEYELVGRTSGPSSKPAIQLDGMTLKLELGTLGQYDTKLKVATLHGKPRLRRTDNVHQIQRQMASALLLPTPRRDADKLADGTPVVLEGWYIIKSISLFGAVSSGSVIDARVESITVTSGKKIRHLSVSTRAQQVRQAWASKGKFSAVVKDLLACHEYMLKASGNMIVPEVEDVQKNLMKVLESENMIQIVERVDITGKRNEGLPDPVPPLLRIANRSPASKPARSAVPSRNTQQKVKALEAIGNPRQRRERTRTLRAQRGASAASFRSAVMEAYGSSCMFCGLELPSLPNRKIGAGCEAAHILPYSEFDNDEVPNGLCLCRIHHWAFDNFLLVVKTKELKWGFQRYRVALSSSAQHLPGSSRNYLKRVVGEIRRNRLPEDRNIWPSPEYLELLYRINGVA